MPLDREAWLAERRTGVFSTDTAKLLGLSDWGSPLHVYLDKKGLLPPSPTTKEQLWGLRLEPVVAAAYEEQTGRAVRPVTELIRSVVHPWLGTSLDRMTADCRIVELKTAKYAAGWGEPGTDEIPEVYMVQVQHQMLVTAITEADVAVLIGGSDFRIYHIEAHSGVQGCILSAARAFWECVQEGRPPEPDWSHPRTPELIRQLHGTGGGEVQLRGADAVSLVRAYAEAKEREKAHREDADVARAKLTYLMRDAGRATLDDGTVLTRRKVHRAGYQVDATDYIDFRIRQPKEKVR